MLKSLRLLSHPLSLLALGLVLLNDLFLKTLFPAWWTGKLSDVAELFYLPFLLAGFFAWLAPRRDRAVGCMAFGAVLAGFILLKASPQTNEWMISTALRLTGLRLRAVPDPSDLLALPALAASAWLWFRLDRARVRPLRWQYILIPVAAMVTLADAAAPDFGVNCLQSKDGALFAYASYNASFTSSDGGLTWQAAEELPQACETKSAGWSADLLVPGGMVYRVTEGQAVQLSSDRGITWRPAFQPAPVSEAEHTYQLKTRSGNLTFRQGPLDALVDPATGNLVLAMGQEGVLVGKGDATWAWAPVGKYIHNELAQAGLMGYLTLLGLEILLSAAAALLWLATASLIGLHKNWQVALTVIGWIGFAGACLAATPGLAAGSYTAPLSILALWIACAWMVMLAVITVIRHSRVTPNPIPRLAILALPVFALYLIPYILWALNILPDYWLALVISAALLAGATLWIFLSRKNQERADRAS